MNCPRPAVRTQLPAPWEGYLLNHPPAVSCRPSREEQPSSMFLLLLGKSFHGIRFSISSLFLCFVHLPLPPLLLFSSSGIRVTAEIVSDLRLPLYLGFIYLNDRQFDHQHFGYALYDLTSNTIVPSPVSVALINIVFKQVASSSKAQAPLLIIVEPFPSPFLAVCLRLLGSHVLVLSTNRVLPYLIIGCLQVNP